MNLANNHQLLLLAGGMFLAVLSLLFALGGGDDKIESPRGPPARAADRGLYRRRPSASPRIRRHAGRSTVSSDA